MSGQPAGEELPYIGSKISLISSSDIRYEGETSTTTSPWRKGHVFLPYRARILFQGAGRRLLEGPPRSKACH
ncbi:hypothetical protein cyc_00814 [Cyclospora cayetanensis]|uniref:Uncharacterized protein n=1 Tax=Cyclospora cayetanensis TaxID=88456 RepID=A0A1D3CYP6_9EIME|nr:hypothetical protein cyc_00814 [Cyclospora cayetanensis]